MRRFVALLHLVVALILTSSVSAESVSPSFERLDGKLTRGQLVVNYEISVKSWKKLEAVGIKPAMNLYRAHRGKAKFLHEMKIPSRKGSFTFPKKIGVTEGTQLQIRIHGSSGKHKISAWHDRGRSGKQLAYRISNGALVRAGEPPSTPASQPSKPSADAASSEWRTDVVNACDKHAYISSQKGDCVGKAVKIDPRWAAEAVAACKTYGYIKSQHLECLEIAGEHRQFSPAETAKACRENVYISSQFLDCMRTTAKYKASPSTLLPACSKAVYIKTQRNDCFEKARTLDASSSSLLEACKGRDWEQCLDNAMK